jgi:hypothetical protein
MPRQTRLWIALCIGVSLLYMLLLGIAPVSAQTPCAVVDQIDYPIDTNTFTLVQDFAAPSVRHQGRFHTAEDWYGGRGTSYGQPVRAIATGRVKYSSPLAWGRDGGVVIIEHFLPDQTVAYSQYGHLMETETITFPEKFGCIQAGEIIGVITDARPGPHLHFEMRINQPDTPGPGYTWENPVTLGWRQPDKFVRNWQTWLQSSHEWHIATNNPSGLMAAPLVLNDNSLLYLDENVLRRATPDGRILWRIELGQPAVGLIGYEGNPLLIYADGTIQQVGFEATLGESWSTGIALDSSPLALGNGLLFHSPDNSLVVLSENLREIVWQLPDVPPFAEGQVTGQTIGLLTANDEILILSRAGQLLDRAQLQGGASLSTMPETGALLVYSRGGLWTVDAAGTWSYALPWSDTVPPNNGSGAVWVNGLERIYLFDGQAFLAYDYAGNVLWRVDLPGVAGRTQLIQYDSTLLLTSTQGHIITLSASGNVCASLRIHGADRARRWQDLGNDGLRRVAVADQLLGLDWAQLACP